MRSEKVKNRTIIFLFSAFISLSLFSVILKYSNIEKEKLHEMERSHATERYVRFQSSVESLINENIKTLNGYMAFLSIHDFTSQETAEKYLENLIDSESKYIKNISTLKDTTILFTYPKEGNSSAVGVDLAKVEKQSSPVLKVKENLKPTFQGPIDLIQGERGFVARVPLIDDSGFYEGQISLVLSADDFLQEVSRLEKLHGLKTLFYSTDSYPETPFYGDQVISIQDPLSFYMRNDYINWTVLVVPLDGWTRNHSSVNMTVIIGIIFSLLTFIFTLFSLNLFENSKTKLREKNFEITSHRDRIAVLYSETRAMNIKLADLISANKKNFFDTVSSLVNALDAKDPYTGGHSQRVMEYSIKTAEKMGLDSNSKEILSFGSILHDIGKIGIPELILNKEGPLSDEEYEMVVKHPYIGFKIIKDLKLDSSTKRIIHEHHERVDGKGYPNKLKGEEIHLFSRIVCIADAFDAMTSKRSYRRVPLTHKEAIEELIRNRGTQFDSEILDIFVNILKEEILFAKKKPIDF
jgi:putative nucleotidyltransferase with HDIG domain